MRQLADIALTEFADIVLSESLLPDEAEQALRVFLAFCREKLTG